MQQARFRKGSGSRKIQTQFNVLLLEADTDRVAVLKQVIESRLPVSVTAVSKVGAARALLQQEPDKFFIGITSVLDSSPFEKVDLLGEFNLPVIAVVDQFNDEMRDQLIKRHVIDYVVRGNKFDNTYICDLIGRVIKNCDIKVLVVDDSKVSRFVLERELLLQKFEVVHACNGEEALEKLSEQPDIKLVLVDSRMPVMEGYAFVEQARQLHSKDELIIIGISGSLDSRTAVQFLKAGANDFIAKPFNYEMLLCRISRNLDMLDAIDLAKSLSNVDFLSDLNNRRYFFEQGNKLINSLAKGAPLTVMMMDLDNFKKINDGFGHDVGDLVIKNFANALKTYFPDDIVARIGGEEFAVISKSSQYLKSYDHINAFRQAVEREKIHLNDHTLRYTVSIGVCNMVGDDLDEMVMQADKNLYKAKQVGKNQVYGEVAN
jgi:diguanylate cyclase (GGDEF)-like protein